jgi:hypothetical protein
VAINALAIYPVDAEPYHRAVKRQQWLHGERQKLQEKLESNYMSCAPKEIIVNSDEVPWR